MCVTPAKWAEYPTIKAGLKYPLVVIRLGFLSLIEGSLDLAPMDERTRQYVGSDIRPEILRTLQVRLAASGLRPRILDWGCGLGIAVDQLRSLGWTAQGADIDFEAVERGNKAVAGQPLRSIIDGRAPFDDGSFDFVYSQEVFEHVADLASTIREIRRLSATGADGMHIFPARFRIVEPHVFVPFLHWLPKNWVMRGYLRLCCEIGIGHSSEVNKRALAGLSPAQAAAFSFRFIRDNTFYRSYGTVAREFRRVGFRVSAPILQHRRLIRFRQTLALPGVARIARPLLLTFVTVYIKTHLD
jgi:SAM-dependent methyltransferase